MKPKRKFPSEYDLVLALKSREVIALNVIYGMYSVAIRGVIFRIVQQQGVAEDLLQETFIKIWFAIDKYDSTKGRLFTWMLNIARNGAIDFLRSKKYRNSKKDVHIDACHPYIDWTRNIVYNPDVVLVKELVYQLKPDFHILLEMVYFKGFTHVEIADQLNLPLGTVKTRLRMAIMELRNHFE